MSWQRRSERGRQHLYSMWSRAVRAVDSRVSRGLLDGPQKAIGPYPTWDSAKDSCRGYDDPLILDLTCAAVKRVLDGEGYFERDGMVIDRPEYPYFLIASLRRALDDFEEKCTVVDFGGALGASYRQCQPYLRSVRDLNWCIVEQEKTVELGRSRFQTERLFFKRSVAECFRDFEPPFVLILSGVLQYLPEPMSELSSLLRRPFDHVIVDRTLLTRSSESKVFVQRVSPKMYDASYPFWEVAENVLLAQFADDFECIALDDLRRPNNIGGREFPEYAYHFRRTERHRPQR